MTDVEEPELNLDDLLGGGIERELEPLLGMDSAEPVDPGQNMN